MSEVSAAKHYQPLCIRDTLLSRPPVLEAQRLIRTMLNPYDRCGIELLKGVTHGTE